LKVSKYSLLATLYFFFNSVFLPRGVLYTTLLAPILYFRQLRLGRKVWWKGFFGLLLFFDVVHLVQGVDLRSFLLSNVLFVLVYFFTISLWHFVRGYEHLGKIFRQMLMVNGVLMLIAIPFYFMRGEYRAIFWYITKLTEGLDNFARLSLFTYEASYYALLMLPVCVYFMARLLYGQVRHYRAGIFLLSALPFVLSLSFGVIGSAVLALVLMALMNVRKLTRYRKPFMITLITLGAALLAFLVLWWYAPDNALFLRLANIFSGHDSSARGRTTESFSIAWEVAEQKSLLFGVGLGQVKIMSTEVIKHYYNYWGLRYDIPNAMAETLAIFGIMGVLVRLLLEIWLFFRCRVYTNHYSLFLFLFLFIYQFTGSYITSTVEYGIWVMAFARPFPAFDTGRGTTRESSV
jgi:hypothetical protein